MVFFFLGARFEKCFTSSGESHESGRCLMLFVFLRVLPRVKRRDNKPQQTSTAPSTVVVVVVVARMLRVRRAALLSIPRAYYYYPDKPLLHFYPRPLPGLCMTTRSLSRFDSLNPRREYRRRSVLRFQCNECSPPAFTRSFISTSPRKFVDGELYSVIFCNLII